MLEKKVKEIFNKKEIIHGVDCLCNNCKTFYIKYIKIPTTKEIFSFNKKTCTWKGQMIMDMTKEELINAFYELGELYTSEVNKNFDLEFSLIK